MNIHDRHLVYSKLKTTNKEEIKRDIALLQQKNPKSKALDIPSLDMTRKGQEVLWELLDFATVEEIKAARTPKTAEEIKREQDLKFLYAEDAEIIAKDIAFLAEKAPDSEVLQLSDDNLPEKGKKVFEALLDVVTANETTTEESSNSETKKKANEKNIPTSNGNKTTEKTSKKQ